MTITGYSDRINHALAFAAKHHDREVRKGLRLPYFTAPANVAVILVRYGRGDDEVVAGILLHVVEDALRDGVSPEGVRERLLDKFGDAVLTMVLAAARRRTDDDGVELSHEERLADHLDRIAGAGEGARWVLAAHEVHAASALVTDLRRTAFPDTIWGRFAEGREGRVRWYRQLVERLEASGFDGAILAELRTASEALVERAAVDALR